MSNQSISRRRFIALSVAGVTAGTLGQRLANAERPLLKTDDPMAIALAYVEDAASIDTASNPTFVAGSNCGNCGQYKNENADGLGECALFPGKSVKSSAWCKAWIKQ